MCGPIVVTLLKMQPHWSIQSFKYNPIQQYISISLLLGSTCTHQRGAPYGPLLQKGNLYQSEFGCSALFLAPA